jgi:hypothetical protein
LRLGEHEVARERSGRIREQTPGQLRQAGENLTDLLLAAEHAVPMS